MFLLQNNHYQASTLLRGLLTIIFMLWLVSVMTQYDEKTTLVPSPLISKKPANNIVIEKFTLPPIPKSIDDPVPKSAAKTQNLTASKFSKKPVKSTTDVLKPSPSSSSSISQQQIKQVYQVLSDEGVDIQIAWPRSADDRQTALNFMYQCVGVQFAVLNGHDLTKINHTQVNQTKSSDYSDWIRVAQGSLSKKEQNWLNAYAIEGTPIRLFPQHLDWRLAQHLAATLKGIPLVNLRARYQVVNQRLQLTHIHINNQKITDNWVLYQAKC